MPWQRLRQASSTSSGFIVQRRRILTNAHAVEYGTVVLVKMHQSEKKYTAKVIAVEDDECWINNANPLCFGKLPGLQDEVTVVGYPVGGESISVTSGLVSRIEVQDYSKASSQLLAIQIDAAINSVGAAFQSLSGVDAENIGYVVPVNVIQNFLEDVRRHGRYTGVCGLGVRLQGLESGPLRLKPRVGLRVTEVAPLAPAASLQRENDIVVRIDGIEVASDGIPLTEGGSAERIQLSYHFTERFPSDIVRVEVRRNRELMLIQVPVWVPQLLVPNSLLRNRYIFDNNVAAEAYPSYLVIGGLVFTAVTKEYLRSERTSSTTERPLVA